MPEQALRQQTWAKTWHSKRLERALVIDESSAAAAGCICLPDSRAQLLTSLAAACHGHGVHI
jgi:hypothetical protein